MTHTIYFDLGNVLIFFNLQQMFSQLSACTGVSTDALQAFVKEKGLLLQYETGKVSSEEVYRRLLQISPRPFAFEEMTNALSNIFIPNVELWPVVEKLKAKGHRLVLISNTNECHFQYALLHYNVLKLFDQFILSYQVGACKPNQAIFQRALQEAEGSTFYTDDIPEFIEAGKRSGLDAEVFIDVPTLVRHLEKRALL